MARARTPAASEQNDPPEPAAEPGGGEQADAAEPLTVHQALSKVMGEVQSISKDSRNTSQNFNFRGIDAVLNACGPAFRKWGVIVVPVDVIEEHESYQSSRGASMKNVQLTVTFRFYGPQGDYIEAMARGEAADAGDKATPKAHSVALRTVLLQALCIPTDEPDPDSESHERVHESGFQGGRSDDARARPQGERRQQAPAYNYPKDWLELAGRMGALLGAEEAAVWMAQAAAVATGDNTPVAEMDEDAKRAVWSVLTETLKKLDHIEGDLQLRPDARVVVSQAFAKQLEGQILNGPTWALTGDEAERGYPPKEGVADPAPEADVPFEARQEDLAFADE